MLPADADAMLSREDSPFTRRRACAPLVAHHAISHAAANIAPMLITPPMPTPPPRRRYATPSDADAHVADAQRHAHARRPRHADCCLPARPETTAMPADGGDRLLHSQLSAVMPPCRYCLDHARFTVATPPTPFDVFEVRF